MLQTTPFGAVPNAPYLITPEAAWVAQEFPGAALLPSTIQWPGTGSRVVSLPHTIDTHRRLKELGAAVPHPMTHSYDWPVFDPTKPPFLSQKETAGFLVLNRRAFVLSDMGCGKTRAALYALDWLVRTKQVRKALIFAPLSTLNRVWEAEIFQGFGENLHPINLHGSAEQRLKRLRKPGWNVGICNHDGGGVLLEEIERNKSLGIDLVLIDELAVYRNRRTGRWRAMRRICTGRKYVWGMTGSPTPNSPTDAWAQVRLLDPDLAPMAWAAFREQVEYQVAPHQWKARQGAEREVYNLMQPAVRYRREDVIELPPVMHQFRDVPMEPDQKKIYDTMRKEMLVQYQQQRVTAANAAVLLNKLAQIAGGVVYDDAETPTVIASIPNGRTRALCDALEEAAGKVIVFAGYRHTLALIEAAIRTHAKSNGLDTMTTATVHGSVPVAERNAIFAAFQNEAHPRILLAHPRTMAHGLTLTAADTIIWYTPYFSREVYEQGNARVSRPGQTRPQLILHFVAAPVERHIYRILEDRGKMQALCLALFENGGASL